MKKFLLSIITATTSLCMTAQSTEPNRILIHHSDGTIQSIMVDRLDEITFATVEGEARVDIEVFDSDIEGKTVTVSLQGSEACSGWKYVILPESSLNIYDSDAKLASYINNNCDIIYRQYTESGLLDAPDIKPGSQYALAVLALDNYMTPCEVSIAKFSTENVVAGAPSVEITVSDITKNSFELTFTPNDDCAEYAYVIYPKGQLAQDYALYGSIFSCTSIEDYVINYVTYIKYSEPTVKTFDGLVAGTIYEVSVVSVDDQGNYAPLEVTEVKTLGGVEGEAWVEAEQTDYIMVPVPNPENIYETINLPHQAFWLTPNDCTVKFRAEMFFEDEYEAMGQAAAEASVKRDPEAGVPDDMWFRYKPCRQLYRIDPATTGYLLVAGKNSDGEWGKVNIIKFTTPSESPQE